jgi:surface polysaccharide O-acyltransferase-like enzyme
MKDENKQLAFIVVILSFMFILVKSTFFFVKDGKILVAIFFVVLEFLFMILVIFLTYRLIKKLKLKPRKLITKVRRKLKKKVF